MTLILTECYICDKVQISNYKQFTEKDIIKSSLCVMIILN